MCQDKTFCLRSPDKLQKVTCGLSAEDWDQLQNPMLVSSMGLPYLHALPVTQPTLYQITKGKAE